MRIKAYVLAAYPDWIEASVLSYYDLVEEIVVSYDENSRGWTGVPIPADECLRRLKEIDRSGEMRKTAFLFDRDVFKKRIDIFVKEKYNLFRSTRNK